MARRASRRCECQQELVAPEDLGAVSRVLVEGSVTASLARGQVGDGKRWLPLGEKSVSREVRRSRSAYLLAHISRFDFLFDFVLE